MRWRIGLGGAIALLGAALLIHYVSVLSDQPPFAPTTATLWAYSLATAAGLSLAGWGLWRAPEAE